MPGGTIEGQAGWGPDSSLPEFKHVSSLSQELVNLLPCWATEDWRNVCVGPWFDIE